MRITRTGEDTFTGVAITRIHVFGFPHCTVHDAGQPLFGPITARSNNDSTYYGPWSWWNVSGGGCERVSLDPDSLWAVSADGLSLEVCSETSSGRTSCTSLPRVPTDVVALGDSYSSGEGAGPYRDGGCHRSDEAWINTVVEQSVGRFRLAKLLACSGARVPDLSIPFKGQSAQVSQIPPETDLVTLTIGGNDTGFSEVLTNCVLQNCVNSGRLEEARRDVSRELPRLLAEAYASVRTRMPAGAELVVVGYPRLLPNSKEEEDCGWLRSQERRLINQLGAQLNQTIAAVASAVRARYVDVTDALDGHELCTTNKSWIFPVRPGGGQQRGHPIEQGQRAIARIVAEALLGS